MNRFSLLIKLVSLCILLCNNVVAFAQISEKDIENNLIGTSMPDYTFEKVRTVSDVLYPEIPKVQKMSLKEFYGKWTLVYFWTRNCTPCIRSFPKLNEYQKSFSKDVNVLLVGINDQYNIQMKDFFDGVRLVQKLNSLSYTFDTVLVRKMNIVYSGTALLIDPNGVLRHVMLGEDITKKQLQKIIARKD